MGDAIRFVLGNFTLTFLLIGLIASLVSLLRTPKPRTPAIVIEALFFYFLMFSIGSNFAPGNAGVILYTDVLIPVIGFVLLWLQHRYGARARSGVS